jgi:hypothetical protein
MGNGPSLIVHRTAVVPCDLLQTLSWVTTKMAQTLLEAAVAEEDRFRGLTATSGNGTQRV